MAFAQVCTAIGGPVDPVTPERRPERSGVLGVHHEVRGAGELVTRALEQGPGRAAVPGLPDPVRLLAGRCRAADAAAPTQGRDVHVVGVTGIDHDVRGRVAQEEVTGDVGPRLPGVGRPVDTVAVVAVTGQGSLAGAHVDDRVVRRRDRQRADGLGRGVVRPRRPASRSSRCTSTRHPAPHRDDVAVVAHDQRADAAAHGLRGVGRAADLHGRVGADALPRAADRLRRGRQADPAEVLGGPDGVVAELGRLLDRRAVVVTGEHATGFNQLDYSLAAKWLELLKEIAPKVTRVAVLREPGPAAIGQWAVIQSVALSVGVELRPINVQRNAEEVERAVAAFAREPNGGLIAVVSGASLTHRDLIVTLAVRHQLPVVYYSRFFVTGGGLIRTGPT